MRKDIEKAIKIIECAGYVFMGTEVVEGKTYYEFIPDSGNAGVSYSFTLPNMKKVIKENKLNFSLLIKEDE